MSDYEEFYNHLMNLYFPNLHEWCDAVTEIIGLYDFSDEVFYKAVWDNIDIGHIPRKELRKIRDQTETYGELLQALKDYEFAKYSGRLFMQLSNGKKMEEKEFKRVFGKLQAETHSAEEFKPFLTALAMEGDQMKRNAIIEYLSIHPGSTYEDATKAIVGSKD